MADEINELELLIEYLEKKPNIKIYGDYKLKLGMFYGYLLGSFLMFLLMILINTFN